MRKLFFILTIILCLSLISSAIVINTQPKEIYNLGERIIIPIRIVAENEMNNFFSAKLNCPNQITEITKYPLFLAIGEEKQDEINIPLQKSFIGDSIGQCKIDFSVEDSNQASTNNFKLSDVIIITYTQENPNIKPNQTFLISGTALKENSEKVNGTIELKLSISNIPEITSTSQIIDGQFNMNITIPQNIPAGSYSASISAYEKDSKKQISNKGSSTYWIKVEQVPTSIEISINNKSIDPNSDLKFTPILHDQTGQKIYTKMAIIIKNDKQKTIYETEKNTDEEVVYFLEQQTKPGTWTISAQLDKLNSEIQITINQKELIETQIINNTLIIKNTGNIPYTKPLDVTIGAEKRTIYLNLNPGQTIKYYLTAPDGNYDVQVGDNAKTNVALTGSAIGIQTGTENLINSVNKPIIWIIIIFICLVIGFLILRSRTKKNFGVISPKKFSSKNPHHSESTIHNISTIDKKNSKKSELNQKNKAEISLSLRGEKQKSTLVCLKIKNYHEVSSQKGSSLETIQKIVNIIESKKAYTYDNQENLIFIFAPIKTKTFDNEKYGLDAADKINELLKAHNRNYKQKITYGISIDNVDLIVRLDSNGMVFMPLGSSMPNLKRMSTSAQDEIILSENVKQKVATSVKVERRQGMDGYAVTGIRDNQGNNKMLSDLKKRIGEN